MKIELSQYYVSCVGKLCQTKPHDRCNPPLLFEVIGVYYTGDFLKQQIL